ncbi:SDR family oxidoreductase [soil metagenome]
MKLANSTVLLCGANGGIGSAIARELVRRKVAVVMVSRDEARLASLRLQLHPMSAGLWTVAADIAQPGAAAAVVARATMLAGPIDILINCAGVQNFGLFADEAPADSAALFNVNTISPIALVHAALPSMLARGRGQIVNVGSIFGSIGFPCFATYSASKFALRGFSEALRRELSGSGVSVTYVAPRFTRTAFNGAAVTRMAAELKMGQDDPASVAARVLQAIESGAKDSYLGWPEKLFVRINAILPRLVDRSLFAQMQKMRPFAGKAAAPVTALQTPALPTQGTS